MKPLSQNAEHAQPNQMIAHVILREFLESVAVVIRRLVSL